MKAVILAGGLGTRLSEETHLKPKPMVEIGGRPILWHIMKISRPTASTTSSFAAATKATSSRNISPITSCISSDVTFDIANNRTEFHQAGAEPWRVTLIDTGERRRPAAGSSGSRKYLENDEASASPMATASPTSTSRR